MLEKSLEAVTVFAKITKLTLKCLFSSLYSGDMVIFTVMWAILLYSLTISNTILYASPRKYARSLKTIRCAMS